jgi:hypothetical protein
MKGLTASDAFLNEVLVSLGPPLAERAGRGHQPP